LVGLPLYAVVPTETGVDLEVFRPLIGPSRASTIRPRLPRPWALLQGLTAAVSLRSRRLGSTRRSTLARNRVATLSKQPSARTYATWQANSREQTPEGVHSSRAVPLGYTRRQRAETRRQPAVPGGQAASHGPRPKLTTPWLAPRLAETIRRSNPSHLHAHFGEPKRSKEMTCGTTLVACHSLASEQPVEIAVAARLPLRGETHRDLVTRRARPTRHETPQLPRAYVARLAASGPLSVPTRAVSASTVQQLERLQAAGSSPNRRIGRETTCLRRLPLPKQREDIRNTSTNPAHHRCK